MGFVLPKCISCGRIAEGEWCPPPCSTDLRDSNNLVWWPDAKLSTVAGGRVAVYVPEHPGANNRGYVLRSRLVMEESLGRLLTTDENVHHINGDQADDRIENLELLSTAEHTRRHWETGKEHPSKLDYDKIKQLRAQGLGYKRIAKAIGRARSSVRDACHKLEGKA